MAPFFEQMLVTGFVFTKMETLFWQTMIGSSQRGLEICKRTIQYIWTLCLKSRHSSFEYAFLCFVRCILKIWGSDLFTPIPQRQLLKWHGKEDELKQNNLNGKPHTDHSLTTVCSPVLKILECIATLKFQQSLYTQTPARDGSHHHPQRRRRNGNVSILKCDFWVHTWS